RQPAVGPVVVLGEDDAVESRVFHAANKGHPLRIELLAEIPIPHPAGHGIRHRPIRVGMIGHALPNPDLQITPPNSLSRGVHVVPASARAAEGARQLRGRPLVRRTANGRLCGAVARTRRCALGAPVPSGPNKTRILVVSLWLTTSIVRYSHRRVPQGA